MGSIVLIIIGILIGKFLFPNKAEEEEIRDEFSRKFEKNIEEKDEIIKNQSIIINNLNEEIKKLNGNV